MARHGVVRVGDQHLVPCDEAENDREPPGRPARKARGGRAPLTQPQAGRSGARVVSGDAGIGTTALMDGASEAAAVMAVRVAVRGGGGGRAAAPRPGVTGGCWGLGLAVRSRALVTAGPGAEEHYLEPLDLLERHRLVSCYARTHLVYGEWLRREGRRQEARDQLRTAHRMLTDMGAHAFAGRAAKELRATGEHPRKRAAHATDALTAHELQIARLVSTGATTREVAQQLFLSPRTVEAHLRNIFPELGISSRRQIKDLQLSAAPGR